MQGENDDSDSGIHNQHENRRRKPAGSESSCTSLLQFIFMSAIIPALFFLRMARNDDDSFIQYKLTLPESLPAPFDFLPFLLRDYAYELMRQQGKNQDDLWLESDIVELHHCRSILTIKNSEPWWGNFTTWAHPFVNESLRQMNAPELNQNEKAVLQQEIILELLELYGTHRGNCNFERYRPTISIPDGSSAREKLLEAADLDPPEEHARCAFVITIRRRDADHVKRLVHAIHMPHHFIVLHLEEQQENNQDFANEISTIASAYENVAIVQFRRNFQEAGDSMSNLHLRIMRWLTMDLRLEYDYHITLDEASFPLLSAGDLAKHLFDSSQSVWLGALTEKGTPDCVQYSVGK